MTCSKVKKISILGSAPRLCDPGISPGGATFHFVRVELDPIQFTTILDGVLAVPSLEYVEAAICSRDGTSI
jgi:hypothetical protein